MSVTTIPHVRAVNPQTAPASEPSLISSVSMSSSSTSTSESSDPLDSDYSEEEGIEDEEKEHAKVESEESAEDEDEEKGEEDEEEEEEEKEDEAEEEDEVEEKDSSRESEEEEESTTESSYSIEETKRDRKYALDDIQIIKTIGTGTFGRVYLCKDNKSDSHGAMKILSKADVIRLKQVEHVKNEKNILAEVDHPFIVNMLWSTKDESCLYMLFEYVCGGELFTYLRNAGRFDSPTANFYATEIILALEYLHSLMIVYRDLKPENLLITRDGHLKITDFGFAKKLRDRTWTLCGTPEYLAPEIIQSKGHNRAVDWWALGILIYEMIVGYPPFYDDNPFGIYEKILSGKTEWPKIMDPIVKDLVKKLLVLDRTKRLGNMKNGAEDVKKHRWFKHVNWHDVLNKKTQPPIMPEVNFDGDTRNFDEYPETDWKAASSLDESDMQLFDDF